MFTNTYILLIDLTLCNLSSVFDKSISHLQHNKNNVVNNGLKLFLLAISVKKQDVQSITNNYPLPRVITVLQKYLSECIKILNTINWPEGTAI